eukprot:scaffold285804_cov27-Prasinocladus_malaysianus.AAC.3
MKPDSHEASRMQSVIHMRVQKTVIIGQERTHNSLIDIHSFQPSNEYRKHIKCKCGDWTECIQSPNNMAFPMTTLPVQRVGGSSKRGHNSGDKTELASSAKVKDDRKGSK